MAFYDPLTDTDYMSSRMRSFFKEKLLTMRRGLVEKEREIYQHTDDDFAKEADRLDIASDNELKYQKALFQEHERELLESIDCALKRIETGQYGYCECHNGKPIGLERLLVVPTTRYCQEAQALQEESWKK